MVLIFLNIVINSLRQS